MKTFSRLLVLSILLLGPRISSIAEVNTTTIENILNNPKTFLDEMVEVTGWVPQFLDTDLKSTSYYILRGDKGGPIRVHTPIGLPETLKKYKITGIVYYDDSLKSYFISEKSRTQLTEPVDTSVVNKYSNENNGDVTDPTPGFFQSKSLIIYGSIVLGILVVVLLVVLFRRKKTAEIPQPLENKGTRSPSPSLGSSSIPPISTEDFKTIRLNSNGPKTVKLIPGELKIIGGEDKGRSFKISGFPTPEGNVVTIGRAVVSGEKEFSHIQLKEKTVSREQALIIQKANKLLVKNLSETNLTRVDGVELKPGESVEIKPNSTIKAGEVEFQYIV
jgi:hypothetical protein